MLRLLSISAYIPDSILSVNGVEERNGLMHRSHMRKDGVMKHDAIEWEGLQEDWHSQTANFVSIIHK
jgi:hypothetical protein